MVRAPLTLVARTLLPCRCQVCRVCDGPAEQTGLSVAGHHGEL